MKIKKTFTSYEQGQKAQKDIIKTASLPKYVELFCFDCN